MSLVFIGGVEIGFSCLEKIVRAGQGVCGVITLPKEAAAGTSGYVDFAPFCREHQIPFMRTWNASGPEALAQVKEWSPQLGVVCGWQRLVAAAMLRLPPRGFVGFHTSLLPHYRGRAPVNWAIIKGEKETGATMFFLEPEADTGPIIDQRAFPISPFDTCATVYANSARACAAMLLEALPGLLDGSAPTRPNPSSDYPCMPKRTPADGAIDWERSALEIHDFVRALTKPYPGAFTEIAGLKYFIWQAAPLHPDLALGLEPGQHALVPGGAVFGCGQGGALLVLSGQFQEQPQGTPDAEQFSVIARSES